MWICAIWNTPLTTALLFCFPSCPLWFLESHSGAGDSSLWEGASFPRLAPRQPSVQLHDTCRQVSTAAHLDSYLTVCKHTGNCASSSGQSQIYIDSLFCSFFFNCVKWISHIALIQNLRSPKEKVLSCSVAKDGTAENWGLKCKAGIVLCWEHRELLTPSEQSFVFYLFKVASGPHMS